MVDVIRGAQARGHRSYRHVDMGRVRAESQCLPEDGVPPEIVRLLEAHFAWCSSHSGFHKIWFTFELGPLGVSKDNFALQPFFNVIFSALTQRNG